MAVSLRIITFTLVCNVLKKRVIFHFTKGTNGVKFQLIPRNMEFAVTEGSPLVKLPLQNIFKMRVVSDGNMPFIIRVRFTHLGVISSFSECYFPRVE